MSARSLTPGLKVVVVLGPTATGKTALALRIAETFGGEVVSVDSRYFYRGMDIGTAKPTPEERARVPHHLVDILEPTEPYALGVFLDDAYRAIETVAARGALPVVAGGTPQYLRALLEGWVAPEVPPDASLRARLAQEETSALYARLQAVDPTSAARIGPHNKRRMIRALEVFERTGQPMSELARAEPPPYRFLLIGLTQPRDRLYARIDARVRDMVAAGWLEEVRRLRERGVTPDHPAMSAHGYRELYAVLEGQLTLKEAIQRTCAMVHRYVRHQETWFRRFEGVHWLDSSKPQHIDTALALVAAFLREETEVTA